MTPLAMVGGVNDTPDYWWAVSITPQKVVGYVNDTAGHGWRCQ
jgi:hypothetical protein